MPFDRALNEVGDNRKVETSRPGTNHGFDLLSNAFKAFVSHPNPLKPLYCTF